jgi:hypothetical protein
MFPVPLLNVHVFKLLSKVAPEQDVFEVQDDKQLSADEPWIVLILL